MVKKFIKNILIVGALALTPTLAFAQVAPSAPPSPPSSPVQQSSSKPSFPPTVIMPTQLMDGIYKYLNSQPAAQTRGYLNFLDMCLGFQTVPHGALNSSANYGICQLALNKMQANEAIMTEMRNLQTTNEKLTQELSKYKSLHPTHVSKTVPPKENIAPKPSETKPAH